MRTFEKLGAGYHEPCAVQDDDETALRTSLGRGDASGDVAPHLLEPPIASVALQERSVLLRGRHRVHAAGR